VRTETLARKYVGDGWETVARLCGWDVVDMRGAGEVGLIRNMPRQRVRLMSSSEGLVKRRGLNYSLVGKLLVGRGNDAQSWRRFPL
jgi:hypothetical protein